MSLAAQKLEELINEARKDENLKKALLENPKAVIKEKLGVTLPEGKEFNITEKDFDDIQKFKADDLLFEKISDDELDMVAGGCKKG